LSNTKTIDVPATIDRLKPSATRRSGERLPVLVGKAHGRPLISPANTSSPLHFQIAVSAGGVVWISAIKRKA